MSTEYWYGTPQTQTKWTDPTAENQGTQKKQERSREDLSSTACCFLGRGSAFRHEIPHTYRPRSDCLPDGVVKEVWCRLCTRV